MTDLNEIISRKSYDTFAGPDWPSYSELLAGARGQGAIQQEVDKLVVMMRQYHQELTNPGDLALGNQQRQRQIFYDKQVTLSTQCKVPWNTMGINTRGDVFICQREWKIRYPFSQLNRQFIKTGHKKLHSLMVHLFYHSCDNSTKLLFCISSKPIKKTGFRLKSESISV